MILHDLRHKLQPGFVHRAHVVDVELVGIVMTLLTYFPGTLWKSRWKSSYATVGPVSDDNESDAV